MNAYEKIRAALEQAYKERHEPCSVELRIDEALAALAELGRAAAEPVGELTNAGTVHAHPFTVFYSSKLPAGTKLYAAPLAPVAELERAAAEPVAWMWEDMLGISHTYVSPKRPTWPDAGASPKMEMAINVRPLYAAPVAEIREVVVTDEMCNRAYISKWRGVPELIDHEPDDEDRQWAREWLSAWRAELGPALGMVELKEPTPEECERICTEYERLLMREGTCGGRDAFDAVKAVMWPKEGES